MHPNAFLDAGPFAESNPAIEHPNPVDERFALLETVEQLGTSTGWLHLTLPSSRQVLQSVFYRINRCSQILVGVVEMRRHGYGADLELQKEIPVELVL